jgi:hypothetical protein
MVKSRYSSFKKILVLCLLLLNANMLLATEGVKSVFKFRYVELSITQNYSSFHETRNLLFKGRAQLLNDFIGEKIFSGNIQKGARLSFPGIRPCSSYIVLLPMHQPIKKTWNIPVKRRKNG